MTCERAIITEVVTVTPEMSVEDALKKMTKHSIRIMPVVDADNKYLGMFSFNQILKALLPVSATMEGGLDNLDFLKGTYGDVILKLEEVKHRPVERVMKTDTPILEKDTVFWEVLLLMYKFDAPLPVVDKKTGKLQGIVSKQSAISDLNDRYLTKEVK